jgi:hypothetical protein
MAEPEAEHWAILPDTYIEICKHFVRSAIVFHIAAVISVA